MVLLHHRHAVMLANSAMQFCTLPRLLHAYAHCADRYPAAKMKAFAAKLHARGQHWVPIINPAVGAQPGFRAFDEGNRDDVWIKDTSGRPYVGQVGAGLDSAARYVCIWCCCCHQDQQKWWPCQAMPCAVVL